MATIEKQLYDSFLDALAIALPHVPLPKLKDNTISFQTTPQILSLFEKLNKMFHISTEPESLKVKFTPTDSKELKLMTNLLLVSRLNPNLLSEMSKSTAFRKIRGAFAPQGKNSSSQWHQIKTVDDAIKFIFLNLENKNLTQRELSEATGLSQATLVNLKKGGDIKLSNFLQICNSLNLQLAIK